MNFALMISCKVEEKLAAIERGVEWGQQDEAIAYDAALKEVLAEDGRAWADGNIRVGDYILISMSLHLLFPLPVDIPIAFSFAPPTPFSSPIPAFTPLPETPTNTHPQSTPTRASPPTASSTPSPRWSPPPTSA